MEIRQKVIGVFFSIEGAFRSNEIDNETSYSSNSSYKTVKITRLQGQMLLEII